MNKNVQPLHSKTLESDNQLGMYSSGKPKWYHQVFQGSFHLKRHSLPFQVEAALKYLVVPLTFAHDWT